MQKPLLPFPTIAERIKQTPFPPEARQVVGILHGGTVPAALVAWHVGLPLDYLHLHFRKADNEPEHDLPRLLSRVPPVQPGRPILLVDDVSVSGATFRQAAACFPENPIITVALKGRADLVLFPEIQGCVRWPWHPPT